MSPLPHRRGVGVLAFLLGSLLAAGLVLDFVPKRAWSQPPPAETATVRLLKQAAEAGNVRSQTCLGDLYRTGTGVEADAAQAAEWYRMAALAGDARAQAALGDLYAAGLGVERNPTEAAIWYRMAAAQGHAGAQSKLGAMCASGEGMPVDFARALALLHRSAAQGHAAAQFKLGVYFMDGIVAPQDLPCAYYWLSLAARNLGCLECARAEEKLAQLRRLMSEDELRRAHALIRNWQRHR